MRTFMNDHAGHSISVVGKALNGPAITNLHAAAVPNPVESRKNKPDMIETKLL
jgi:hypothetical protein